MRGKKAKAIRKFAQQMTIGQPVVEYAGYIQPRYVQDQPSGPWFKISKGVPRRMIEGCTRYFYKTFKK